MSFITSALESVLNPSFATSYRFEVHVGTFDLGAWAKCDGLQIDYQVSQYQTAMNPDEHNIENPRIWNYLSRPTYKPISLSRPCTTMGMAQTAAWLKMMWYCPTPEFGAIIMWDANYMPVYTWQLTGIVPDKWSGPSMDVDAAKVATETLVLSHEGWIF